MMGYKKDNLYSLIHAIGRGKPLGYTNTVSSIANEVGCSRSFASRHLRHFADCGFLSRIRAKYKNTYKDYFCSPIRIAETKMFLVDYCNNDVVSVQINGVWEGV